MLGAPHAMDSVLDVLVRTVASIRYHLGSTLQVQLFFRSVARPQSLAHHLLTAECGRQGMVFGGFLCTVLCVLCN